MPYCIHCGAHLEEGQLCSCPAAQAERAEQPPAGAPDLEFVPLPQDPEAPSQPDPAANPQPDPSAQAGTEQPAGEPDPPEEGPGTPAGPQAEAGSTTTGGTAAPPSGPAGPAAPSPVMVTLKNLLPFLRAYCRSPVQATRAAVSQQDLPMALLLCLIQCLAAVLALAAALGRISRLLIPFLDFFGLGRRGISLALAIPCGLLAGALGIACMTAVLFALARLNQSKLPLRTVFLACGVNTIPVTAVLLLSFLLGLLSLKLGVGLLCMVLPVFAAAGLIPARQLCPETDSGKFWLSYLAGVILAAAVTWLLLSALLF